MNILPKRFVRSTGPAVGAAATFIMTAFAIDSTSLAAAQGRLEAEYTASLAGIPIGRGNWVIEISEDQFTATASGGTFGIMRAISAGRGNSIAQGTLNGGQLVPMTYAATITNEKRIDDVRMVFVGGSVKDLSVEPPLGPSADRIPVTDADRRNVHDPMTATLDPSVAPAIRCRRKPATARRRCLTAACATICAPSSSVSSGQVR